jgi:virulence-associated protein VagC
METATVIDDGECQKLRLPKGFHLATPAVAVRREGEAIVLEPLRPRVWPEGFLEAIHISDPAFVRPDQGRLPPLRTDVLRERPGFVQAWEDSRAEPPPS